MAYTSMVNIRRVQQIHIGLKQVILALIIRKTKRY